MRASRCVWLTIGSFIVNFYRGFRRTRRSRWKPAAATVGWSIRWNGSVIARIMQPAGGQAADVTDQQDGQAGRQRAGHPASQGHSTGGLDSAWRIARSTRTAPSAHPFGENAHASENRIQVTLARHKVQVPGEDLFGVAARLELGTRLPKLPIHCREAVEQELAAVNFLKTRSNVPSSGSKRS
jgi:hypothetical protein